MFINGHATFARMCYNIDMRFVNTAGIHKPFYRPLCRSTFFVLFPLRCVSDILVDKIVYTIIDWG